MAICSVQPGARCCGPVHAKPTHQMECGSVDFTVLQQSHAWNRMYVCWIGCASTIPHMKWKVCLLTLLCMPNQHIKWNVCLLTLLCFNNPMHDVECVSVELAVLQQSHAWSGMCICWHGCAATIQHMKWNVYLLNWLCFNNPMHEVECVSVDLAVLQQSHA